MTIGNLKNARRVRMGEKIVAVGNVYNIDRFEDGEKIKTAPIVSESDGVVYTKSSSYNVEWASTKIYDWNDVAV